MEGSGDAYRSILGRLREQLPEVADHIEQTVALGRCVPTSSHPEDDRVASRAARMRESGHRFIKGDVAAVPLSDDERLTVLLDVVENLARSMAFSREWARLLLERIEGQPLMSFQFEEGDGQSNTFDPREDSPGSLLDVLRRVREARGLLEAAPE